MYSGKILKACEIRPGFKLMGPDGKKRVVLRCHHGYDEMYRVTPVKGEPFIVNSEHLLPLVKTNEKGNPIYPSQKGGKVELVTVGEWHRKSQTWRHVHKLYRSDIIHSFGGEKSIPVDPYFVGVLLGDGEIKYGRIDVTTMDPEVVEVVREQAELYQMEIKTMPAGKATTYYLRSRELGCKGGRLYNNLKRIGIAGKGSGEKAVPFEYKTAPAAARAALLAGLLDTDGSLNTNVYDFISKSHQLAEDLAFIARSLGLAAYVRETEKGINSTGFTGKYWRVSVSGNTSIIPCRVKHKQATKRTQIKDVRRTGIQSIEAIGEGEYFGFTVDGDNLYLMDDFTVTHNCGKTIIFSAIAADEVRAGKRVLILAHRGELLTQAADKLEKSTGLGCAVEKAEQSCLDNESRWYRVTVGSVQSLQRPTRLARFDDDYFQTIIIDEAHHALSDGYKAVMDHFPKANILGVTATPDRGDHKSLGEVFDSLAYEYTLVEAIKSGYLCKIKAQTIPLQIDLSSLKTQAGDYSLSSADDAISPYLEAIAKEMETYCKDRKTVVFLPLIKTSKKMRDILQAHGFNAAEVNGQSEDREEILRDFENGKYNVLCNSMLLTEGWDCPCVDCIICLRPTKVRGLYCQIVGRGTRLYPGKDHLLILDFLWLTDRHDLCRPADLIAKDEDTREKMTKKMAEGQMVFDLEECEKEASEEVAQDREAKLAEQLEAMRKRKAKLVDPLQFASSVHDKDLINYVPELGWEKRPVTDKQKQQLEKAGINFDGINSSDQADMYLSALAERRINGYATPKQIRFLENKGFLHVGQWSFQDASNMITRISFNSWHVPHDIDPKTYVPNKRSSEELPF